MKRLNRLNFYEILEVPVIASDFEIRQAYRALLTLYSESSAATYALFSEDERAETLEIIEKAFETLIDARSRTKYNKELLDSGLIQDEDLDKKS